MLFFSVFILFFLVIIGLINTINITPWEDYLELGHIERPLGLIVNQSSLAHRHFYIGYLCLHSFLYDTAQEAFELAIEEDPTLVEAHIGRLLGHKQPLWYYTNRSGALQVWDNTWSLFTERNVVLTTPQSIYLNTAYQWFIHEDIAYGERAFLVSIFNLTQAFPTEIDAQTLLGLSYLNVAEREKVELHMSEPPTLLAARKVLEAAITSEPSHPGALHYLIHAYDVPRIEAALQGVPYAHKYGQVASTASHGQHMPGHIWIRIGAWLLAQKADERAIEVSLSLCMIKLYQMNYTQLINKISSVTISHLLARLDSSQHQALILCDQENRAHSQEWLIYSYLQTGRFGKSYDVLHDLVLSHNVSSPENFYLSHVYSTRAFIAINAFFWVMHDGQKNHERFLRTMDEILVRMDPQPIQILTDNTTSNSRPERNELFARYVECIRLLMHNINDTQEIDSHLLRMTEISSIIQSKTRFSPELVLIMVSHITALRWCLQGLFNDCLIELDKATQFESSLHNDQRKPDLIPIRSAELLAFYLLVIHRHYPTFASTYVISNRTIAVNDFPLYALELYAKENFTDPHRGINLLGMARAYSQMEQRDKANQLYERLLREWAESSVSSNLDKVVIEEAIDYLLESQIIRTKNNGHFHYLSFILYSFCFFSCICILF